jgi:hypothetical protein
MIIELLLSLGGIIARAAVISPCSKITGHAFLGLGVFDSFDDPASIVDVLQSEFMVLQLIVGAEGDIAKVA